MFKVAGVSRKDGVLKLRFANDMLRVKVLERNGHKDIHLVELKDPKGEVVPMSKDQAVAYLAAHEDFAYIEAQALFADYQTKNAPKQPAQRKVAVAAKEPEVEDKAPEVDPQQAKRDRDNARKREARAKAKLAKSGETVAEVA